MLPQLCCGLPSLRLHQAPSFYWLHPGLSSTWLLCGCLGLRLCLSPRPLPSGLAFFLPSSGVTSFYQTPFFASFPRASCNTVDVQTFDFIQSCRPSSFAAIIVSSSSASIDQYQSSCQDSTLAPPSVCSAMEGLLPSSSCYSRSSPSISRAPSHPLQLYCCTVLLLEVTPSVRGVYCQDYVEFVYSCFVD